MADPYNRGLKPSLLYPARLRITLPDGDKKWLRSTDEARKYMQVACKALEEQDWDSQSSTKE